jgi:hypothetical protein
MFKSTLIMITYAFETLLKPYFLIYPHAIIFCINKIVSCKFCDRHPSIMQIFLHVTHIESSYSSQFFFPTKILYKNLKLMFYKTRKPKYENKKMTRKFTKQG